ncbi:hypothetical protein V2J09_023361 [Rumex salicifolius]
MDGRGGSLTWLVGSSLLDRCPMSSLPIPCLPSFCRPLPTIRLTKFAATLSGGAMMGVNTLCLPHRAGSLGIRPTRKANIALIGKLGWNLLNKSKTLWSETVKYKVLNGMSSQAMMPGFGVISGSSQRRLRTMLFDTSLLNLKVREMWSSDGEWMWEELDNKLPRHILLQIASLSLATDGDFTTASAYSVLTTLNTLRPSQTQFFGSIWKRSSH